MKELKVTEFQIFRVFFVFTFNLLEVQFSFHRKLKIKKCPQVKLCLGLWAHTELGKYDFFLLLLQPYKIPTHEGSEEEDIFKILFSCFLYDNTTQRVFFCQVICMVCDFAFMELIHKTYEYTELLVA